MQRQVALERLAIVHARGNCVEVVNMAAQLDEPFDEKRHRASVRSFTGTEAPKKRLEIGGARQRHPELRVILFRIPDDKLPASRHDMSRKLRRCVVEDHEVHVSADGTLKGADQPEAHVETLTGGREPPAVEDDTDVDVALAMSAARPDAAEQYPETSPSTLSSAAVSASGTSTSATMAVVYP